MGLTTADLIVLDLDCTAKEDVIKTLAQKMVTAGIVEDYDKFLTSLFEREEIAATTVGYDIGLPHGKAATVKKGAIAFATLKKPVVWNLENDEKVKTIFMLAIPESEKGTTHVNILVDLSKKILDNNFRDQLTKIKDVDKIVELINK